MSDLIGRQDFLRAFEEMCSCTDYEWDERDFRDLIKRFPSAESEYKELQDWKTDFKGFIGALDMPRDDYRGIMEYIDEVPSAETEIIKCKDCKFYTPMNRETKTGICNLTMHQNFGDEWYCAGAERKTDE